MTVRDPIRFEVAEQLPPSLTAATLCEAFQLTAARHADAVAFPADAGKPAITWSQYAAHVEHAAGALAALGLVRGDTAALLLTNRREFHYIDTALTHLGVATTSLYNTAPSAQLKHVIDDSRSKVVVTEQKLLPELLPLKAECAIETLLVIDAERSVGDVVSWARAIERISPTFDIVAAAREVKSDDVLCLMYTSGSTGSPKGVELTHRNMLSLLGGLQRRMEMPVGASQLSYLPMAHGMARIFDHYLQIALAFEVTTCPEPSMVAALLPTVRPSFFASTPRLWEKLRAAVYAGLAAQPDARTRHAAQSALSRSLASVHAHQRELAGDDGVMIEPISDDDTRTLTGLAAIIGMDRIAAAVVGGAPVDPELLEFFHAIGIPLGEAYGLTECGGGATANPAGRVKCGTVGPPLAGMQLKLADDGEILIKGPGIMRGYRNHPAATRAAFTEEGWLRSGDIGTIDDDGYLRITDRKKELIINSAGKNMSPVAIEAALKHACPLIGQAVAVGDRKPYVVALIVPEHDVVKTFAQDNAIDADDLAALLRHPSVLAAVDDGVNAANRTLSRAERVKHYAVLENAWEPGSDELTPTAKLRRRSVLDKYRGTIERLYVEADARYRIELSAGSSTISGEPR